MKTKEAIEIDEIKKIESGYYRDYYLVYNRRSLDEPDSQKNSIKYQGSENVRMAEREGLPIAPVTIKGFCTNGLISENHSAFKEGDQLTISDNGTVQYQIERPKFLRLVQFLSRGHFKGVIVLCWDRLSRNDGDETIIKKLKRRGVDIRFAYASYEDSSSGELHMDIDGMFAKHHSRVTSEKVRISMRESRANGKCTYAAPIGYLNIGTMDSKPFDPERAPIIKEMFELYATGEWSLSDLERHGREHDLTTVPVRPRRSKDQMLADDNDEEDTRKKVSGPVTYKRISTILRNPFYTGRVIGPDGNHIPSTSHV